MNEVLQKELTPYVEAVKQANDAFLNEWQKKTDNETEINRQQHIIEAIETELEALKTEAKVKIESAEMPSPEFYAQIKQKELDLLDKKGYLELYLKNASIKEKERLILLNQLRRESKIKIESFKSKAFKLLLEDIFSRIEADFKTLIALNNSNLSFREELFFKNQSLPIYTELKDATKSIIFEEIERRFNFDERVLENDFLQSHHYLKEFSAFEEISPIKENRMREEIKQLKAKQLLTL